jgi:hypothetical protein
MVFIPPTQYETCPACGTEYSSELSSCPRCGKISGWRSAPAPLKLVIRRKDGDRKPFGSGCLGVIVLVALAGALASKLVAGIT